MNTKNNELKPWFTNEHFKLNLSVPLPNDHPSSCDFQNKNYSIVNFIHPLPPLLFVDPNLIISTNNEKKVNKTNNDIKKMLHDYLDTSNKINNGANLSTKIIKNLNTSLKSLNTKLTKKINNQNKFIVTQPHYLSFNQQQKSIVLGWMYECNRVYNLCVDLHNKKKIESYNYMKLKLVIFKRLYNDKPKPVPYDILTDVVKEFCSNYKSCLSNLAAKNIKHFELKKRNPTKNNHSICILAKQVTTDGICVGDLGNNNSIINNVPLTEIVKLDSRLIYNKNNDEFILKCPNYIDGINCTQHRENIIALDPGGKIFQSYYGLESYGHIGEDIGKVLLRKRDKISKYQKILSKKINKKGKKLRNKEAIKKKIRGIYKKIKNVVKELHNKTANYLCKKAEIILIPEFGTSKMVKSKIIDLDRENNVRGMKTKIKERIKEIKEKRLDKKEENKLLRNYTREKRLRKNDKYILNQLSHYEFKQHLLQKGEIYGCKVQIVTEEYTSQTCTLCGEISKKYVERMKECTECKYKINRDINGSRNILLKSLVEMRGKYRETSMGEKMKNLKERYK